MTTGVSSQLSSSTSVLQFVDEMEEMVEKSAPLKNFLFDTTTPHGDVVVTEASAMKPGIGWITLQATEGIRRGVHEWCVKIENQGETSDGSGLMLGIVPSNYSKFDSFISQGGGWCLSRAGKFYGHWRRQDSRNNTISFGTDDRVVLLLDYEAARLSVRVGNKIIVGEISDLAPEVFPAISLHYRRQHVRFEYHVVHDGNARQLSWIDRPVLRPPSTFLPLSLAQLYALKLDSYVFSVIFVDRAAERKRKSKHQAPGAPSSAKARDGSGGAEVVEAIESGEGRETSPREAGQGGAGSGPSSDAPYSLDAAAARLIILCNTFTAVQRYIEGSPPTTTCLSETITAEYLRQRMHESSRKRDAAAAGSVEDAAFNCGAVILSHLFTRVASDADPSIALPLAESLLNYVKSLPIFSLGEGQYNSQLIPDVIQLATDNIVKIIERSSTENSAELPSQLCSTLIELTVALALQRGLISETLRGCRFLFLYPNQTVSSVMHEWLQKSSYGLRPQGNLPSLYSAIRRISSEEAVTRSTISTDTAVLSAAYCNDMVYVHTTEGLSKWGKTGSAFVQLYHTMEPSSAVTGVTSSSIGATSVRTLLVTDAMQKEGICAVAYSVTLTLQNIYYHRDVSVCRSKVPASLLVASGPMNQILMVYNEASSEQSTTINAPQAAATPPLQSAARSPVVSAAQADSAAQIPLPAPPRSNRVEMCFFDEFPKKSWSKVLEKNETDQFSLSHCLALRKPSYIDLGSPEEALKVLGGHVTIELYLILLDKDDGATIYQHGNRSNSGEVFIELARLEGAFCIRGGFRHDSRGSCVVFAPIPPSAETRFMHVALVFQGSWSLYFDGVEVSASAGPQVSVDTPRHKWTVGVNCTCLLAGLRVWRVSRASREISRDYRRPLSGNEPGLVCHMFFNETAGNVVFNYVSYPKAQHGVCNGSFMHHRTLEHPWKSYFSTEARRPVLSALHNWWDLSQRQTSVFTTGSIVGISQKLTSEAPYATQDGWVVMLFDTKSGQAHPCMFVLSSEMSSLGKIGCDHSGALIELFDFTSKAVPPPNGLCVAVGCLTAEGGNTTDAARYPMARNSASSRCERMSDDKTLGWLPLPAESSEPFTFIQLGSWLLQLLSSYAEEDASANGGELFSILADDVSQRCVTEVKLLLSQHFRVVKSSNGRRAVSFKNAVSPIVISSVLTILLRLVQRTQAFSLHPTTLGLNVVAVEQSPSGDLSPEEANAWIRRVTSTTYLSPGSSIDASTAADGLLALIGDIINESNSTTSPHLGTLAKAVLYEGVELFFPNLHYRVSLLREMLTAPPVGSPPFAKTIAVRANNPSRPPEKTPAVELLLNAMICSLGSIQNALPLLCSNGGRGYSPLEGIQKTLDALVEESLVQLRKLYSPEGETTRNSSTELFTPLFSNVLDGAGGSRGVRLLASLTESISSLQMLLLSSSQQGRGRDPVITSNTADLFSFPKAEGSQPYVQAYYKNLFRAAQDGLTLALQEFSSATKGPDGAQESQSLSVLLEMFHCSFLSAPLYAAVSAIPLVVTIDEAQWYLGAVESLLPFCNTLKGFEEMGADPLGASKSCDSLYETALFTSTWIATYMAQHSTVRPFSSLVTAPVHEKVQPEQEAAGGSSEAEVAEVKALETSFTHALESGSTASLAVRSVCDHPLLSGGLQQDCSPFPERMNPQSSRRQFVLSLMADTDRIHNLLRRVDPLVGKVPAEFTDLTVRMAVTALYLSNTPKIECLPRASLNTLLIATMKRFFGVRAMLLSQSAPGAGSGSQERSAIVAEMKQRLSFLLCFTCVLEINVCEDSAYMDANDSESPLLMDIDSLHKLVNIRHRADFPSHPLGRWRWAARRVRRRLMRQRVRYVSSQPLNLSEAVKLISSLMAVTHADGELSADALQKECNYRNKLGSVRLKGLGHLIRLLYQEPSAADNVASLLTCGSSQFRLHHLVNLGSAHSSLLSSVTSSVYRLVQRLRDFQLSANCVNATPLLAGNGIKSCASAFQTVLSKVVNRSWEPQDFGFLSQLQMVDVIFHQSCTIFGSAEEGLKEMGVYERIHRDAAVEYEKNILSRLKDTSTEEDQSERSLIRTPEERSRHSALQCLQRLAIQCASCLTEDLSPPLAESCCSFMCQLFDVLSLELQRCIDYLNQNEKSGEVDRVSGQMHLLCSLIGVTAAALPANAKIAGALHHRAAQLARWLCLYVYSVILPKLNSSLNKNVATMRGASCLRAAVKLLIHVNPCAAIKAFDDVGILTAARMYFSATKENDIVILFLFSLAMRSILIGGLNCLSQHAIIALRSLIQSPRWSPELSRMTHFFHDDMATFGAVHGSSDSRAHIVAALKMYVWSTALGGCLLFLPAEGLPVQYTQDGAFLFRDAFMVDRQRDSFITVPSSTVSSSVKGDSDGEEKEHSVTEVSDKDVAVSEDSIFMPSFSEQVQLPQYEKLLDDFIMPALEQLAPLLEKMDHIALDLFSVVGFLSIALSAVQQHPTTCNLLLESGTLRFIHQLAGRLAPRDPFPMIHLKEWAAYAMSSTLDSLVTLTTTPTASIAGAAERGPHSPSGARTIMMSAPSSSLFGWTQARYTIMSIRDEHSKDQSGVLNFGGMAPVKHSATVSPPLLCFPIGKSITPAYVAVTRTESSSSAGNQLFYCGDGLALEAAVLLADRLFPALGEDVCIPSQWLRPDFSFDLMSLYAFPEGGSRTEDAPLLRVSVRGNELMCSLNLPQVKSVEISIGLRWDDWDTFLYLGVFLDDESLMICRGREKNSCRLPPEAASILEQRKAAADNAVMLLMVGSPPQPPKPDAISNGATESHYLLVSGLRLSNSTKAKNSTLTLSDEVSREGILTCRECDTTDACFLPLTEASGGTIQSLNGQYTGELHGGVRWVSHKRRPSSPLALSCSERLNTGVNVTSAPTIPRKEIQAYYSSLDSFGLDVLSLSLFESLSAHLTRMTVLAALRTCLSPEYEILLRGSRVNGFDALRLFEKGDVAKQLSNLLRYCDSGVLASEQVELIHRFVIQCVEHLSQKENELQEFFADTASAVKSTLSNSTEVFPIYIPSVAQSFKGCPLLPLALLNGGNGVLSFDVKGRFVEHANIFKDRTQKTILAKFPDNKGGWPDFVVPSGAQWLYVRNYALSRHQDSNSRVIAFNVVLRSMRSAVMNVFFGAACSALHSKPRFYQKCLPSILNSQLVFSLLPKDNLEELDRDGISATAMLSTIFHLWSKFPSEQPYDQCPLSILLASVNSTVVSLLRRSTPGAEDLSFAAASLESYNTYTRLMVGVLISAINLEAVWYQRSYRIAVWERWCRLIRLWEQSASHVSIPKADVEGSGRLKSVRKRIHVIERMNSNRKLIDLDPVDPPSVSTGPPLYVIHQRGSGEWFVRSERDPMTVRSSVGFTRGRIYFEVRMPENNVNLTLAVGVVTEKWLKSSDGSNTIGLDSESWSFDIARLSSSYQGSKAEFTSRVKWKMGDVAGVLLDLETNQLSCFHNDRQVSSFEKLKVTGSCGSPLPIFFPAVYFGSSGCNINFGSAPFSFKLPGGALPVDPSHFHTPEATKLWYIMAASGWANALGGSTHRHPVGLMSSISNSMVHDFNLQRPSQPSKEQAVALAARRELKCPILSLLLNRLSEYSEGRCGALSVDLLCSSDRAKVSGSEVRVEDASCLVRGSVTVFSGKWYYEVVTRDEAGLSIGWAVADRLGDWSRNRSLGDDEYSWALEGRRMIAKHNKHQVSLARHVWKSGNVVGCLLDCDAGTIAYTINGNVQREVHETSGERVLFRNVDAGTAGITPAMSLEPKSEATFMWNNEDLLYLPPGYKPLGASNIVTRGLTEHYLLSLEPSSVQKAPPSRADVKQKEMSECRTAFPLSVEALGKMVRFTSRAIDLNGMNLSVYCLEKSFGIRSTSAKAKDGDLNVAGSLGLSETALRSHLFALHVLASSVERIYPYCYEGSLSLDANGAGMYYSPLYASFSTLKQYCLSYFTLRVVRRLLMASNQGGENLKLTLNRRRAVLACGTDSMAGRLQDSLFGQVYALLSGRSCNVFCTNKKLWSVAFLGEGADDVGGPYRDSLSQICSELMSSMLPLFIPSPNQVSETGEVRETFVLAPFIRSPVEPSMYQFLGRLIGGCLRSAEPLALYLPSVVWTTLVGNTPTVSDLERVDAATMQSLQCVVSYINDTQSASKALSPAEVQTMDDTLDKMIPDGFTITDDNGTRHELFKGSSNFKVTFQNFFYYYLLTIYTKLGTFGSEALQALKEGFFEVVPLYHVSCLKWYELEELVCGQTDYDPDVLMDNAHYDGIEPNDDRVRFLREVLKEFSSHQRASFMRFVSGRERFPPGLRIRIKDDNGGAPDPHDFPEQPPWTGNPEGTSSPFRSNIGQEYVPSGNDSKQFNSDRLPHASTCFYWLFLPRYANKESLKEKLLYAIEQCFDIDADFRVGDQDASPLEQPVLARVTVDDEEFEDYSHLR